MGIEYIGNKAQSVERLWAVMSPHIEGKTSTFADLFCGTATVSAFMRGRGYRVTANDTLLLCTCFAQAALLENHPPSFDGLVAAGVLPAEGCRYRKVLEILNGLPPVKGFIYRTYSPASAGNRREARMYFTKPNAATIDAIRAQIRTWEPHLTEGERAMLLVDLIKAASQVSNVAGTYGCYLKSWKPRALDSLVLHQSEPPRRGPTGQVLRADANHLASEITADIVYADPPYTKRQYAAYYHVLETIAAGDEPDVTGSTGLRPWEHASSDYCYRRKAPTALKNLVLSIRGAPHFFLSYNEDGQIAHDEIIGILGLRGEVTAYDFARRRYKSSALKHKGTHVTERLYHVRFAAQS